MVYEKNLPHRGNVIYTPIPQLLAQYRVRMRAKSEKILLYNLPCRQILLHKYLANDKLMVSVIRTHLGQLIER